MNKCIHQDVVFLRLLKVLGCFDTTRVLRHILQTSFLVGALPPSTSRQLSQTLSTSTFMNCCVTNSTNTRGGKTRFECLVGSDLIFALDRSGQLRLERFPGTFQILCVLLVQRWLFPIVRAGVVRFLLISILFSSSSHSPHL